MVRIEWLNKNGSDRVVVFFNGWGMDRFAVAHLAADCDVVMVYDYRSLSGGVGSDFSLEEYREVVVVAWSMGVWAAANLIPEMKICPARLIALNGTERPVDDRWGIPSKIYRLTEKGMNEQGRKKFLMHMLEDSGEQQRWEQYATLRPVGEVCEELMLIRSQSAGLQNTLRWDKVFVSENDLIFPSDSQEDWWTEQRTCIEWLPGGHYPFDQFRSWEEIIDRVTTKVTHKSVD